MLRVKKMIFYHRQYQIVGLKLTTLIITPWEVGADMNIISYLITYFSCTYSAFS